MSENPFIGNWRVSSEANSTWSGKIEMTALLHCNNETGSIIRCDILVMILRDNTTNGKWISIEMPPSDNTVPFTVNGKNITDETQNYTGTYNSVGQVLWEDRFETVGKDNISTNEIWTKIGKSTPLFHTLVVFRIQSPSVVTIFYPYILYSS